MAASPGDGTPIRFQLAHGEARKAIPPVSLRIPKASATGAAPRLSRAAPMICAVILFGVQAFVAASKDSQTWDEAYAIAAGFRNTSRGDFSMVPENPPLLGLLVSLPLKLAGARLPEDSVASAVQYGRVFLYGCGNDHHRLLLVSRCAVIAAGLAAVAATVGWAGAVWGMRGAWCAAALCASEPNWLAHGHLVAWDGLATATITLAVVGLAWMMANPRPRRALGAGVLMGVALAAKHTALILLPLAVMCVAWASFRGKGTGGISRGLVLAGLLFAGAILAVGASYNLRFRYDLYADSIGAIYRMNQPGYQNYLLGSFSDRPFFAYYFVALAVKTPCAFLPLLVLGALASVRSRRAEILPAATLAMLLFGAAMFNRYNIGIRHITPVIPSLIVLASGAVTMGRTRYRAAAPLILAALMVVETGARAPQYLPFFNVAAGGPARGIRILDESNVDWGQDLERLASLMQQEGNPEIGLIYYGSADPAAYGIRHTPILFKELREPVSGRFYAISAHIHNRLVRLEGEKAGWLRHTRPWRIAGASIYVYRF